MWKDSTAGYVHNSLLSIYALRQSLINDKYKIDNYTIFTIYEPKKRVIVSTRLKDRVFQRSLCDNYFYRELTKTFIYDNCACQIGKGTDFALNRLSTHLHRYFRKYGCTGYVLKCDIKDYFGSTRHDVAEWNRSSLPVSAAGTQMWMARSLAPVSLSVIISEQTIRWILREFSLVLSPVSR